MKHLLTLTLFLLSAFLAQADWKTWLHGTPAKATPAPPEATAAVVTVAPGVASDERVVEFMRTLAEALRAHDGAALKPWLSPKFTFEEMPAGHDAVDLFMQGVAQAKSSSEIIVRSVEAQGDGRLVTAEFRSTERPPKLRTFHFDAAGKLTKSDLFKLQMQHGSASH